MKILKVKTNTNHYNRVFQILRSFHPCSHHILCPISSKQKKIVFAKPFFFTRESKETFDFPFRLPPLGLLMSLWIIHTIYDICCLSCEESLIKSCKRSLQQRRVVFTSRRQKCSTLFNQHLYCITGLSRFLQGKD